MAGAGAVQRHDLDAALRSARVIVPLVLDLAPACRVVDIGCGTGAWLAVCAEHGVEEILGVDGEYVRDMLRIPADCFLPFDLHRPLHLERRYDLAISLEVADQLSRDHAEPFVASLTGLADVVLFSAAIPGQGGQHHKNEQWPEYWGALFAGHDYVMIDCLRRQIWWSADVSWWYAQNIMIYARRERLEHLPALRRASAVDSSAPLAIIHPRKFAEVVAELEQARDPARLLRKWALGKARAGIPPQVRRVLRSAVGRPARGD